MNVALLVAAVAVAYNQVKYIVAPPPAAVGRVPAFARGDLAPEVKPVNYRASRRTLLLVVNSNCRFCTASMPFYSKLAAAADRPNVQVVAASREKKEILDSYLKANSFVPHIAADIGAISDARLNVTPTLLVINQTGRVEQVFTGQLSEAEEKDLIELVSGSSS